MKLHCSRRSLLGGAAATLAGWPVRSIAAGDPRSADLVVRNAKVYTVEASAPRADAFAVRDGRFIAVGSNDAVAPLIGKGTEVFDARGLTIVPAETAGIAHRVGSLAPGKDADVLVVSGNPIDPRNRVDAVFIEGERVYDAAREIRRW